MLPISCITLIGSYFNLYKFLNNIYYWKLCADYINNVVGHKISKEIVLTSKLATKPFSIYISYLKMPWDWEAEQNESENGIESECLSASYEL